MDLLEKLSPSKQSDKNRHPSSSNITQNIVYTTIGSITQNLLEMKYHLNFPLSDRTFWIEYLLIPKGKLNQFSKSLIQTFYEAATYKEFIKDSPGVSVIDNLSLENKYKEASFFRTLDFHSLELSHSIQGTSPEWENSLIKIKLQP